jgi:hypothetical protein
VLNKKILDTIKRLNLDLSGKIVLTEAATGAYVVTAIIAALAGAEVYAFTKNTKYGSINKVREQTNELCNQFDETLSIKIIDNLTPEILSKIDIITNSGHLRPLDENKLKHLKKGSVIPLMYEDWEWRESDLNLDFCKKNNILVGATNERHPDVDVFSYLGDMALKMIFDADLCLHNNSFILLCNNDFGPFIAKTLASCCYKLLVIDKDENKKKYEEIKVDFSNTFDSPQIPIEYKSSAAIIFTAYPFDKTWIGDDATDIKVNDLIKQLDTPFIVRYAGDIDEIYCKDKVPFYPKKVTSGHMGILPSEIGFDPIIKLQAGGLKVGELLLKGETYFMGNELVQTINI